MKKFKKNQIVITGLAVMIAVAGYINYAGNLPESLNVSGEAATEEQGGPSDEVSSDILSNDADPDDSLMDPGEVIFTSGDAVTSASISNVISSAKLNREQVRAKNKELLLSLIDDKNVADSAKTDAIAKLTAITSDSEREMAAEILLEAKGFNKAVVSMVDGSVDVVVGVSKLTDTQRAQIEDIVKRKTGVSADKITINICNNQNN